jgi:hypothetical protein
MLVSISSVMAVEMREVTFSAQESVLRRSSALYTPPSMMGFQF